MPKANIIKELLPGKMSLLPIWLKELKVLWAKNWAIINPLLCSLKSVRWLKTDCNVFSSERWKAKTNFTSIPKLYMIQEIAEQ